MKTGKNILKSLFALCSCVLLMTGCFKEPFAATEEKDEILLNLSVNTRMVDEDGNVLDEIAPEAYESNIKTLRIYAFTNRALVGHEFIEDFSETPTLPYNFMMHVASKSTTTQSVDFFVIANEAGLGGATFRETTSYETLENMTFSNITGLGQSTDLTGLSMPNVSKQSFILDMEANKQPDLTKYPEHEGHTVVGQVWHANADGTKGELVENAVIPFMLHRPTGKFRIFAASLDETATMTILSASLVEKQSPSIAYVMPHTESDIKTLIDDFEPMSTVPITITDEARNKGCKYFAGDKNNRADRLDDANYTEVTARAYYPHELPYGSEIWSTAAYYDESGNAVTTGGTQKGNVLHIKYSFDGGVTSRDGTVYLPPIKRNTYYAIYCLMNNTGKLTIEYKVMDWNHTSDNDWDMDFEYPSYSALYHVDATSFQDAVTRGLCQATNPECWIAEPTTDDPYKGCFVAKFDFTGPDGATVVPAFKEALDTEIGVEIYHKGSAANTITADPDPYTLVIRPKGGEAGLKENKTIRFAISWNAAWNNEETVLLLINQGLGGEGTLWKDSGDETNVIEIDCYTSKPKTTA